MIDGHPEPPEEGYCEICGYPNIMNHCAICHRAVCYPCLDGNTCLDCVADLANEAMATEAARASVHDAEMADADADQGRYEQGMDADARAAYEAGGGDDGGGYDGE